MLKSRSQGSRPAFPTYDAAGNIIHTGKTGNETAPIAFELYDGWGRQVISDQNNGGSITDLGDTRTNYDGLGRMIGQFVDGVQDSTNNSGTTEEYYYNEAGQIIEVYNGSTSGGTTTIDPDARERTVWDDSYVNAAAMQELDNNTDGTTDQRLYALWDANYNVIALAADHGYTVERFLWTPYGGEPAALNGQSNYAGTSTDEGYDYTYDFTGTDYSNFRLGFQGMRWDGRAGEYRTMTRAYLPSLGTFASRDPLGTAYQDGMNLYQFVEGHPLTSLDPTGLAELQPTPQASLDIRAEIMAAKFTGVTYGEGTKTAPFSSYGDMMLAYENGTSTLLKPYGMAAEYEAKLTGQKFERKTLGSVLFSFKSKQGSGYLRTWYRNHYKYTEAIEYISEYEITTTCVPGKKTSWKSKSWAVTGWQESTTKWYGFTSGKQYNEYDPKAPMLPDLLGNGGNSNVPDKPDVAPTATPTPR